MVSYWKKFLKKGGYVTVTEASWFTEEFVKYEKHGAELYHKYKEYYGLCILYWEENIEAPPDSC